MSQRWTDNIALGPIDENLQIDFGLLQEAFVRGLRSGPDYLIKLDRAVHFDNELEIEASTISEAFALLASLIEPDWNLYSKDYSLNDLEAMLDDKNISDKRECIYRIGLIAYQLENQSPTYINRRESGGTSRSVLSQISGTGTSKSDEYEEDFEEDDFVPDDTTDIYQPEDGGQYAQDAYSGSASSYTQAQSRSRGISRTAAAIVEDDYSRSPLGRTMSPLSNPIPAPIQHVYRYQDSSENEESDIRNSSISRRQSSDQRRGPVPQTNPGNDPSVASDSTGNREENTSAGGSRRSKSVVSWIRDKKYQLGVKIGSGSFGEVYQCMNHEGKLFAVKQLHVSGRGNTVDSLANALATEITMMRDFRHINIVRYIGAAVVEKEGVVNIFQEWVPGGSVAHMLKTFGAFPQRVVATYTRQILLGLDFLHKKGIVHRDIKGGNVLVHENGTVKLADFGASTRVEFDKTQETDSIKGTPYFMAPEVLAESKYGRKGDIWAVGCTMIQMLTAQPPWKDRNLSTMVQLHLLLQNWTGPPPYDSQSVAQECRDVIEACFQRQSSSRPSAEALLDFRFLLENELDQSWGSQQLSLSGRVSFSGTSSGSDKGSNGQSGPVSDSGKVGSSSGSRVGGEDAFGDSATLQDIKMTIMRAVGGGARSNSVGWESIKGQEKGDGDMQFTEMVAKRISERQQQSEGVVVERIKPRAKGPGSEWDAAKDYHEEGARQLASVAERSHAPLIRYGGGNASDASPTTPSTSAPYNPYARGAKAPPPRKKVAERAEGKDEDILISNNAARPTSREAKETSTPTAMHSSRTAGTPSTPKSGTSSTASTPTRMHSGPRDQSTTPASPSLNRHRDDKPGGGIEAYRPLRVVTRPIGQPAPLNLKESESAEQSGGSRPGSRDKPRFVRLDHAARGQGSARDTEDCTPSPYVYADDTPSGRDEKDERPYSVPSSRSSGSARDRAKYVPVAAGEGGELLLHSSGSSPDYWECSFCRKENSPDLVEFCLHCAKVRVQKIVNSHLTTPTELKGGKISNSAGKSTSRASSK